MIELQDVSQINKVEIPTVKGYDEWMKKGKEEKEYEHWLFEYEDDISILFAESGADRELCFDREKEDERLYEMFRTDVNKFLKLIGRQ